MSTERLLELLNVMGNRNYDLAKIYMEEGDDAEYRKYMAIAAELDTVVFLMTKQDFAERMWNIYFPEEQTA